MDNIKKKPVYFVFGCSQLTMLWQFQVNREGIQSYIPCSLLSQLPSHPGCHITLWAEFHVLPSRSLLVVHFKYSRVYLWMDHILFIHSFIDRCLGCFHFLPIVSSSFMNMSVHISIWVSAFTSFEDLPRSGIARTYGNSMFNFFLRNNHNVLHFPFPPAMHRFPISSHPCKHSGWWKSQSVRAPSGGHPWQRWGRWREQVRTCTARFL